MNVATALDTLTPAADPARHVTATATGNVAAPFLSSASGSVTTTDSSSLSASASMLGRLQELLASHPDQFKQVMTSVATKLAEAANAATDPASQQVLSSLAKQFQSAADTNSLAPLTSGSGATASAGPRAGGPPAGSPPPGKGGATAGSTTAKAHDPADTNYDGKVSSQEALAYAAKQAMAASHKASASLASASKLVEAELAPKT